MERSAKCQNGTFVVCSECDAVMAKNVFGGWKCFNCGHTISEKEQVDRSG